MRNADRSVEKPEVVVDFSDRAHGRSRASAGGLLLDRNGGAQAVDPVHIRAFHLVEKLAGIGGKGLNVAPLALGVDRVESKRGLARSAEPGDDGEGVSRDLDIDVL